MENNRSDITYAEAYRIYNGKGFCENVAKISITALGMFLIGIFLLCFISFMSGNGFLNPEAADALMPVWCGITAMLRMFLYYEKDSPGGKYFRTVKGGFDTFVRADIMTAAERILTTLAYLAVVVVLDATGLIKLKYGINSCISTFIFIMLFVAVSMFLKLLGNKALAGVCFSIVLLLTIGVGYAAMSLTDGKIGAPHIAAAAAIAFLMPISLRAVHINYRKKYWDN